MTQMQEAAVPPRHKLPERRQGLTETLIYRKDKPGEIRFVATFDWEEGGRVREVFCIAFKEGTDIRTMLHHACIVLSVALQRGETMADLAHTLGEDDPSKEPASILGLIVRAGVTIDEQLGFVGRAPKLEPAP